MLIPVSIWWLGRPQHRWVHTIDAGRMNCLDAAGEICSHHWISPTDIRRVRAHVHVAPSRYESLDAQVVRIDTDSARLCMWWLAITSAGAYISSAPGGPYYSQALDRQEWIGVVATMSRHGEERIGGRQQSLALTDVPTSDVDGVRAADEKQQARKKQTNGKKQ